MCHAAYLNCRSRLAKLNAQELDMSLLTGSVDIILCYVSLPAAVNSDSQSESGWRLLVDGCYKS